MDLQRTRKPLRTRPSSARSQAAPPLLRLQSSARSSIVDQRLLVPRGWDVSRMDEYPLEQQRQLARVMAERQWQLHTQKGCAQLRPEPIS